jgi:hypothetical protein
MGADTLCAMRKLRVTRRRAIVAALAAAALVELVVAVAVLADRETKTRAALPLHPVAGSFAPDDTTLGECSDDLCFEQAFGNVAYRQGPRAAITLFDETIEEGDPSCHRIAHAIGAASLARYEGNVARTFAEGSSTCFSGYYHGVLERALVDVKARDAERLGNVARALCDDPQVHVSRWMAFQCYHGLGHGLMITTGYGLPLSLDACERVETYVDRNSCKGGVFMENITSSYGFTSRWLRDDDPVYPCNAIERDDRITCYGMVTSRIIRVIGLDWEETAEICAGVEERFVVACFRSLGRDISGQYHRDPDAIVEHCAVAREYGAEVDCISAAATDMTSNFASGVQASGLCEAAPAGTRGKCYYGIGGVLGRFTRTAAEYEADCRELTANPQHVARCVAGTEIKGPLSVELAR